MTEALLIVALKTDQPNIERRLRTILAAAEPIDRDPDGNAIAVAIDLNELVADHADALATLAGWDAVSQLRVGQVAGLEGWRIARSHAQQPFVAGCSHEVLAGNDYAVAFCRDGSTRTACSPDCAETLWKDA